MRLALYALERLLSEINNFILKLPKKMQNLIIFTSLLLSGILLVFGFAPYNHVWLSIIILPFLYVCLSKVSIKIAFVRTYIFALGLYGFGIYWLGISIHNFSNISLIMSIVMTIFVVIIQSFYFCIGTVLFVYIKRSLLDTLWTDLKLNKAFISILEISIFASVMTFSEFFRTTHVVAMPWLLMGYMHTDTSLSIFAPIIGVYGLSWITYIVSAGIGIFLFNKHIPTRLSILSLVLSILVLSLVMKNIAWTNKSNKSIKIMLTQANRSLDSKWDAIYSNETLKIYSEYALRTNENLENVDVVVFPETFVGRYYNQVSGFLENLANEAKLLGRSLIVGIIDNKSSEEKLFNSIFAYDSLDNPTQIYHKEKMVLFGEYTPKFIEEIAIGLLRIPFSTLQPSEKTSYSSLSLGGFNIAPLICYDIAYPYMVVKQANNSEILLEILEGAWFKDSIQRYQHLQISRMRAMESGKALARSSSDGITAIIDRDGDIIKSLPSFTSGILVGEVPIYTGETPFSKYYNIIIGILGIHILSFFIIGIFLKFRRK